MFNNAFGELAHLRRFNAVGDNEEADGEEIPKEGEDGDDENGYENLQEFPILETIVTRKYNCPLSHSGIMAWIKDLYRNTRGLDLGVFGGVVLASAFKAKSTKWEPITKTFMSDVIILLHRFIITVLDLLCANKRGCNEIWSAISDEVLRRYKRGMDQAAFLLKVEREKKPFTMNHYFNENLQKARSERLTSVVKGSARKELVHTYGHSYERTGPLMVELQLVENLTINKGNLDHTTEEIHDILLSYYKVARKRFADNVYHQAVDHTLLTGEESPLRVFCQE